MNQYELCVELIKVREKFHENKEYSDETTLAYFEGSVEKIDYYFKNSEWKDDYLFYSMGYYDNKRTNLIKYRYNESEKFMNQHSVKLMNSLTQKWINKDESLSMTEMFLHEKNHKEHYKALLYKLKNGKGLPNEKKLAEFLVNSPQEKVYWFVCR